MTWGNKLLIAFIVFALLMGSLVYKCMQQNFELVSKDYYKEELRYQDKIDGMNNAHKLSKVSIEQTANEVFITLPIEVQGLTATGDVLFYCATKVASDRRFPLRLNNEGRMVIEKNKLAKTNYIVKLTWQTRNNKYYSEQSIKII